MAGLTTEGFERALQDEISAEIGSDVHGNISAQLEISEATVIGNLVAIFSDHLAQAWELLEEATNGLDPENATDSRLVSIALLTGVTRRGQTKGLVTATVNLDASKTFAPGALIAHAVNEPSNRWVNRDTITSTTAGNYSAVFEAEVAGPASSAAAGTLTVIAGSVSGWNSITNAVATTPGSDVESIEDLRARREASLALAGSGTVDAIRADLLQVPGVLQVLVEENTTDATAGTLSPHSFRAVVWDGSPATASNNAIAQAIHGSRPVGIKDLGSVSGTAIKADGITTTVAFQRATAVPIFIDVSIVSAKGVTIADVRAAILAEMSGLGVGDDVKINRILASVFTVDGVDDTNFVEIGITAAPSGTANIVIGSTEIATFNSANIVVTGNVS